MRISANIDINEPSEDEYRLFAANSMTNVLLASGRHICVSQRDTNMASPYIPL